MFQDSQVGFIVENLIEHGKARETPAAVIHMASTGGQRTVTSILSDLPAAVEKARLTSPSIVFIGEVVELRYQLAWFERRPLFGKSVLVTRPRDQARELAQRLEELGAVVHLLPAVEILDGGINFFIGEWHGTSLLLPAAEGKEKENRDICLNFGTGLRK